MRRLCAAERVPAWRALLRKASASRRTMGFPMSTPVFTSIVEWLTREQIAFRHVRHEPTFTSEESAKARGESVQVGGKALLVKVGDEFKLFVLSAALKFDSGLVKKHFG